MQKKKKKNSNKSSKIIPTTSFDNTFANYKYVDKDICKKCGGKCCKKSGCDYSPRDFSKLDYESLYDILLEGNISIVSTLRFKEINGKLTCSPLLYLRARNNSRGIVDLMSPKSGCKLLTLDGCPYTDKNRPSGGKNLIPKENGLCKPIVEQKEIIKEWENYQKVLSKLVKTFTSKDVMSVLYEDISNTAIMLADPKSNIPKDERLELYNTLLLFKKYALDSNYSNYSKTLKK